ncbi:sensor domain-containing diguanylate cyclase [Bacillus spongiae]|uniref:Sensor domain-containing diguanylate cyclase n=1 Tax=Bacillus spongiae TaxID=2683610 RepID=A0ABU8H8M5_9BACI
MKNYCKEAVKLSVSRKATTIIWLIWLALVPTGIWLTYLYFPPSTLNILDILLFIVLATVVALLPIVISGTPVYMIQTISFAAFLKYGLFFEVILIQFSIIPLMLRLQLKKEDLYRYPLNSTMFFFISIISGLTYYGLGGVTGSVQFSQLILPSCVYIVMGVIVNQFLLYYFHHLIGRKRKFFSEDMVWDSITTITMFPVGLNLYFLNQEIGLISFFLIGFPVASVSFLLSMYRSSEDVNESLQKAVEIGHDLTERLKRNEVLDVFLQRITQIVPVDYSYILNVKENRLELMKRMEKGAFMPNTLPPHHRNEGISGRVWATGRSVIYSKQKEWAVIAEGYMPENVESVMCVPIVRNQKVEGVLLLASEKQKAYEKYHLMIVDILCSYFGVAIQNAGYYEETKRENERCALTKLYNYRYFDGLLNREFKALLAGKHKTLSLIILDLDHFKQINDSFGHESGNEILRELALRLTMIVGSKGTVARYGGEEFVVLLPDVNKSDALIKAEEIRNGIANRPFTIHNSLSLNRNREKVKVTASIGIASAPNDGDDGLSLIRHADRALYIGAKRAGRNRVAEYVK